MKSSSNKTKNIIQGYEISFDETKSQKSHLSNQDKLTDWFLFEGNTGT